MSTVSKDSSIGNATTITSIAIKLDGGLLRFATKSAINESYSSTQKPEDMYINKSAYDINVYNKRATDNTHTSQI